MVTLRGIEPDPLLLDGGRESETVPSGLAQFVPQFIGIFDGPSQRGWPSFPNLSRAVVGVVADLTPGASRVGEKNVLRVLFVDGVPEADLAGHGELGEEPCDEVVPRATLVKIGGARCRLSAVANHLVADDGRRRVCWGIRAKRHESGPGPIEASFGAIGQSCEQYEVASVDGQLEVSQDAPADTGLVEPCLGVQRAPSKWR